MESTWNAQEVKLYIYGTFHTVVNSHVEEPRFDLLLYGELALKRKGKE